MPHMSDLKHVIAEKRAANIPPSYAGVRDLFKAEPAMNPETPSLVGGREMFYRARGWGPSTPILEGVDEMLATPAGYMHQETTHSNEVEMENMAETQASAPRAKHLSGKPTVADQSAKPGSQIAAKTPDVRPMREWWETPTDEDQLADCELRPDVPPAKYSKPDANAFKGSNVM
jgi:hypothetical protein